MHIHAISRGILLTAVLVFVTHAALSADLAADVERVLRDIRLDSPVPQLDYLRQAKPINVGSAYYQGRYHGIEVTVETHPNNHRVASVLLQIAGPDQTRLALPAVTRVIGPPQTRDPKQSTYRWEWPGGKTASIHYAGNGEGQRRFHGRVHLLPMTGFPCGGTAARGPSLSRAGRRPAPPPMPGP